MRYRVTNPLLNTRAEADDILFKLHDMVQEYGCVRVKDVYDMVCLLDELRGEHDSAYGWLSMKDAVVKWNESYGAYEICLPVAVPLTDFVKADLVGGVLRQPKLVAEITICGAVHLRIDDTMDFVRPTPEQIKNLHDMLCIDVTIHEEEV